MEKFTFKGEELKYLGVGHAFLQGLFKEYITDSGVEAWAFTNFWQINGKKYKWSIDHFDEIPEEPIIDYGETDSSNFTLPIVKNVSTKTLGSDLISVIPK